MDTRSWDSFVNSTRLFVSPLLFGISQLGLCRSKLLAVGFSLGIFLISPRSFAFAFLGAFIASAWPFYRHRDFRLLMTGYYGVNGALCGLWSEWAVSDPVGAVLLTVIGGLLTAKVVDYIAFPLGDAPFCLPPLSLPFLLFVLIGTLTLPSINRVIELVWLEFNLPDQKVVGISWVPEPISSSQSKLLDTAWEMYGDGRYANAQRIFEELAIQDSTLARVHVGLGWSLFKQNDLDAATRFFRKALKLNPGNPYALDGLGWAAFRHGNFSDAWDWFKTAGETAPLWADPHTGMGWVAYTRGHYKLAQTEFEKALSYDPDYADALNGLGWTALFTRKLDQARLSFYAALGVNDKLTKAHEGLGWVLLQSGHALESEKIFQKALGRTQNERDAIFGLAEARRQLMLQGNWSVGNSSEWEKLVGLWGKNIALIFGLLVLVATEKIWAGFLGIVLATLGTLTCIFVAGPVSILWFDLHISTLALLGILVGLHEPLYLKSLAIAAILGLAGVAIWAAKHFLGIGIPLLEFNMVGLTYLLVRRLFPMSTTKLTRVFSTE